MTQPSGPLARRITDRREPPRRVVPEWVRRANERNLPAKDMSKAA